MDIVGKRVIAYVSDETILDVILFRLEMIGVDAVGVSSDDEMSKQLEIAVPDAILIDLDLDEGTGLYWVEQIASDQHTSHVPMMCLSSVGELSTAENSFKAGASAFLIVPFDPLLLESKLQDLLQHPATRRSSLLSV